MAKSLSLSKPDCQLNSRQIPLVIDNQLTIIMQIDDLESILEPESCLACEQMKLVKKKDYENFMKKYSLLINNYQQLISSSQYQQPQQQFTLNDYLNSKLKFKTNDLLNSIQQLVTCIGCRTSVEKFYKQLNFYKLFNKNKIIALDPLHIDITAGYVDLNFDFINSKSLYNLFYIHGSKLDEILDAIPKNKKNRRCFLHSLDTHKSKNFKDWLDVWELMDDDCRKQILVVNNEHLLQTLDNYLRKHRFCSDCKNKVLKAYNILIGELDSNKEKGYCATLFDGLKSINKNIVIKCDKLFVTQLIIRAEPEIQGSNRERHAKTIDIAQEEVLTCIGIYLYEKFHRIYQTMKSEEQTWQLLFYIGVYTLRKCFEFELERIKCKNNDSNDFNNTTDQNLSNPSSPSPTLNSNKKKKKYNKQNINKNKQKLKEEPKLIIKNNDYDNDYLLRRNSKYSDDTSNDEDEDDVDRVFLKNTQIKEVEDIDNDNIKSNDETLINVASDLSNSNTNISSACSTTSSSNNNISNNSDSFKIDPGYSSGQESNASSNEVCFNTDNLVFNIEQCKCHQDTIDIITCNELIITQPQICGCDFNENHNSCSNQFDIIHYSRIIEQTSLNDDQQMMDKTNSITDEEKNEYFANKPLYLKERIAHRMQLKEKFQNLQFETLKLKPRNK